MRPSDVNEGINQAFMCPASGERFHAPGVCPGCDLELEEIDVAPQQEQPTKAVSHESGTGEVRLETGDGCARKPLTNTNCDTQILYDNSITRDVAPQGVAGVGGDVVNGHAGNGKPDPLSIGLGEGAGKTHPPADSQISEPLTDGLIVDEHLALLLDEGANSSNGWLLHDHINHGIDVLAKRVEGVLLRHKVVEPELAEVGQ